MAINIEDQAPREALSSTVDNKSISARHQQAYVDRVRTALKRDLAEVGSLDLYCDTNKGASQSFFG